MAKVSADVTWVPQGTLFFCGPAVAQMVLTKLGVASPATPPSWQQQLYDYVTTNTNSKRPKSNIDESVLAPPFPEQKCERCSGDPYKCWSTTPTVLKKLLNEKQSSAVYAVTSRESEESATDALCDTLDKGFPAIALINGWIHWVVVDGYEHSNAGSEHFFGRDFNGVYVRDPNAEEDLYYVPWITWRDDYLMVVNCGQYQGKFVVIRA